MGMFYERTVGFGERHEHSGFEISGSTSSPDAGITRGISCSKDGPVYDTNVHRHSTIPLGSVPYRQEANDQSSVSMSRIAGPVTHTT